MTTTGIEPAGTPAVPIPPSTQIDDDEDLLAERELDAVELREEEHRHALEERRAVLVRGRAERQHEAAHVAREARARCSATRSAVGSVALLEAVENAVIIAGRTPRKKRTGYMPPSHATESE